MTEYVMSALAQIESSPEAPQYVATADVLRNALDRHILPSGMEFVITLGWATSFFGSLLSLFIAVILGRKPHRRVEMLR